ncbi:MAG: TetR/AcrR family transcriptional regulator C-terminal domain-containing protein [Pseudomonadota bacterium]
MTPSSTRAAPAKSPVRAKAAKAAQHPAPRPAPPEPAEAPVRKRGRPSRASGDAQPGGATMLSREQILDRATILAKVEPLGEISMVGLARELGVAPTLIHYYVGSRDDLISGVLNRYFKERLARMPPLTGDWREDLRREAMESYRLGLEYGGVLRYAMSHNRFRLFQRVTEGEKDYGVLYLDRMAGIFRTGGFTPKQAAIGYHLMAQFVMTSSYAEVSRQLPAFHENYILRQIQAHPEDELPGAHYFIEAFSTLDSDTAFPEGLRLLIESFAGWLKKPARK